MGWLWTSRASGLKASSRGKPASAQPAVSAPPELKGAVKAKLESPPATLGGKPVVELNRTDGLKLILQNGSWILLRLSGTEPVARCYVEAHSANELNQLTETAREFVLGK